MKKIELVSNTTGGFDLLVERDGGNLVRILTGRDSLEFFKRLKKVCNTAIDDINKKTSPGIDSKEFKDWKYSFSKHYPAEYASLSDVDLYEIFTTK